LLLIKFTFRSVIEAELIGVLSLLKALLHSMFKDLPRKKKGSIV